MATGVRTGFTQQPLPPPPVFEPHPAHQFAVQRAPTQKILERLVERLNKLVKRFSGRPGCGEFRTWKEDVLGAFTLSEITSPVDQVPTISFLLDGDAAEYYHSSTKAFFFFFCTERRLLWLARPAFRRLYRMTGSSSCVC